MRNEWNLNQVELVGECRTAPEFSHENHGEDYYLLPVRVERLSGAEDELNVILSRSLLEQCPVTEGDRIHIEGEVRSFNNKSGRGNRLVISVYAQRIERTVEDHRNDLILAGSLCKPPVYRRTPLGREICDLMLAVNRRYGRADYLPCIAWGSLAQLCSRMAVGDGVRLNGRLQSRGYTKLTESGPVERIAFEVSVMELEPVFPEDSSI